MTVDKKNSNSSSNSSSNSNSNSGTVVSTIAGTLVVAAALATGSYLRLTTTTTTTTWPSKSNQDEQESNRSILSRRTWNFLNTNLNLRRDFPLWVGSCWLLYKQRPAGQSFFPTALDSLVLGLLLSYRSTNDVPPPGDEDARQIEQGKSRLADLSVSTSSSSSHTQQSQSQVVAAPPKNDRYVELLVHNLSHTDLILSLEAPLMHRPDPPSQDDLYCLCRARFSAFDTYSKRVLESLPDDLQSSLISFPRYERSDATPRYNIKPEPSKMDKLPIGLSLETSMNTPALQVSPEELSDLRLRGRDAPRLSSTKNQASKINAVFFPLLGTLLPRWHAQIAEKYATTDRQKLKKVLILVSGVGTPRNWTHSISGNSTQTCASLTERFIHALYPDITVVKIHSDTNIFRYDENIVFTQRELMPCIQSYRDAHAKGLPYPDELQDDNSKPPSTTTAKAAASSSFNTDWRKSFSVTLSFADGSAARNHAIQAAIRSYRPTYFHFWQLKTFWHESKIVDSDVEVHSFEEMETLPAVAATQLTNRFNQLVVEEIKAFRQEMDTILAKGPSSNDINSFWLRKTHKPVLAVLLVQTDPDQEPKLYRGTNMEVSMPTGSLCAERNVIGTALAENPSLKREHLKMIAVLAIRQPEPPPQLQPIPNDSLYKSTSTASVIETSSDHNGMRPSPRISVTSGNNGSVADSEEDWILHDATSTTSLLAPRPTIPNQSPPMIVDATPPTTPVASTPDPSVPSTFLLEPTASMSPGGPSRRINLYDGLSATSSRLKPIMGVGTRKQKRTLVVHSPEVSTIPRNARISSL
jgi:hypothetical protein